MDAELLDTRRAAELLGFSPGTLSNWRIAAKGPRFVRIGGRVRYRRADLDAWIAKHTDHPKEAAQ